MTAARRILVFLPAAMQKYRSDIYDMAKLFYGGGIEFCAGAEAIAGAGGVAPPVEAVAGAGTGELVAGAGAVLPPAKAGEPVADVGAVGEGAGAAGAGERFPPGTDALIAGARDGSFEVTFVFSGPAASEAAREAAAGAAARAEALSEAAAGAGNEAGTEAGATAADATLAEATVEVAGTGATVEAAGAAFGGEPDGGRYALKMLVYRRLKARARAVPPWGALVGVRPVKKAADLMAGGASEREAVSYLADRYDVSEHKARLCVSVARSERHVLDSAGPADAALYVGIPFCRTKCAYCSFPSDAFNKAGAYAKPYLSALKREIAFLAEYVKARRRRLAALYIGGGTPTALPAELLAELLE
ncbi:MAG: hypothetical protein LBL83_06720, partial [Clostridiales bacterium]|nr:hypothetical protein [Clostridiales bacterium]